MVTVKSFCIVGGDLRQVKLANALSKEGYWVNATGFSGVDFAPSVHLIQDYKEAVKDVNVVVAPLPCSVDSQTVNTFFYQEKIEFDELLSSMKEHQKLLAGKMDTKIWDIVHKHQIQAFDYFDREEMMVLNAIPTAEGAIQIAMEDMPITLHNSKCLVLGFGRIGKILSKMLHALGAKVTVEARKYEDLAWIKGYGYEALPLKQLPKVLSTFDVIFNTVPNVLLDEGKLRMLKKDCLVIDLASKPGGVDFETASKLGLRTVWALSLPGKVAPETAGEIIKETILNMLDELEV